MDTDAALLDTISLGCVLRHKQTGDVAVISQRKVDDSGWWVANGGGLADFVIEKDWTFEARSLEAFVDRCDREIARLRGALETIANGDVDWGARTEQYAQRVLDA